MNSILYKDTHCVGRSFEGFIPASMIILSVQWHGKKKRK